MTTSTMMQNGKLHKSLAEQIDRLDGILDGLANALNEAVADAVKEAVGVAVQQTITGLVTEVLTNPQLLDTIRGLVAPAQPPEPTPSPNPPTPRRDPLLKRWWGAVKGCASLGWGRVLGLCAAAAQEVRQVGRKVGQVCGKFMGCWRTAGHFKVPVVTAALVGGVCGVLGYFSGPLLAACMGWLAGFTTTLTVQAGLWLKRALSADSALDA